MSVVPSAPIPPTKPTPPAPPVVAPARADIPPGPAAAAPASPSPNAGKAVSPQVADTVKKLEGLGQAFQGTAMPQKGGAKTDPAAAAAGQTNSIPTAPPAVFSSSDRSDGKTAVPVPLPVMDKKPSVEVYVPFLGTVAIIIIVAVGWRLFKAKAKQPRTLIDYSRQTVTTTTKEGIDVVVTPRPKTSKVKSNFEVRV